MDLLPISIKLKTTKGIQMTWNDGHQTTYTYAYLRRKCPCATCNDRPPKVSEDNPLRLYDEIPITATGASQVGHYAVQFEWNDGHNSGIYSFDYLREICPCRQCHP